MEWLIVWVVLGWIAQGSFLIHMRKRYPDEPIDWGMVPLQLFMATLAGPVAFLALTVLLNSYSDD